MSHFRFLIARLLWVVAAMVLAFYGRPCTSSAQTGLTDKAPNEAPAFRLESNLVIVRVVVRDAGGNPITGLKREDFRLFDEGKEQTISQFEEESSHPSPQRPRFIAFYFDDLNSSDADLMQARDAADRYLAASLQPDDRVAIFNAEKVLSDFTSDPARIHEALLQLRASAFGPPRQHLCPDLSDYEALQLLQDNDLDSGAWQAAWREGKACAVKAFVSSDSSNGPDHSFMVTIRALAQTIVDQDQDRTRAGLQQFEKVIESMAPAPGDRSVVLVSPGFFPLNGQRDLDRIIDRALRGGVVINSLDPKGLAVLMRESDASRNTAILAGPDVAQARLNLDRSQQFVTADVPTDLAHGTGGQFFHSADDLRAGFKALVADPAHYILAFSPKNVKHDGAFHTLKVTLAEKRKGYGIRARRGYFAVTDSARNSELSADLNKSKDAAPQQVETPHSQSQLSTAAGSDKEPASDGTAATTGSAQPPSVSVVKDSVAAGGSPTIPPAAVAPIHLHKGINRVTTDQLQQLVAAAHNESDADLAKQLAGLELTERINLSSLTHLGTVLPGIQARHALLLLTDASAFLKTPASNVPLPPTPSVDEQVRLLKAAANYAVNLLGKLPNFFATRSATIFADSPQHLENTTMFPYEPLHPIDQSKATVLLRDGKETLDAGEDKTIRSEKVPMGLVTTGEFGPLLGLVLSDASRSSLTWSHWERGDAGPVSVYRYAVPKGKSHYQVEFCCISGTSGMGRFRQVSGYHGEMSVDPVSGAILRITLQADLQSAYPMVRADMMVEYGPVEIGGKTYTCPRHSVSIAKAYIRPPSGTLEGSGSDLTADSNQNEWPQQTMINDVEFEQYHVFRSDSRILPDAEQHPQ